MTASPGVVRSAGFPRVLCVDDESQILELLSRSLSAEFDVVTTSDGPAALDLLHQDGSFAVVISDLSMPAMPGDELLTRARAIRPEASRILMTGCSQVEEAATAVNAGQVFRFLTKPCTPRQIVEAVREAAAHHRVAQAERGLIESTLQGAVRMLTHVIGLLQPAAFGRSERLTATVKHMATALKVSEPWRFEMAARLSQLGCVTLPNEIVAKVYAGQPLDDRESGLFSWHPFMAYELLAPIPRLEEVAEMVRRQNEPGREAAAAAAAANGRTVGSPAPEDDDVTLGARMLALALALDSEIRAGRTVHAAVDLLRRRGGHPRRLLDSLEGFEGTRDPRASRAVSARELSLGMELDQDLVSTRGVLVVAKGQEVTSALIRRLATMAEEGALVEPFRVRMKG